MIVAIVMIFLSQMVIIPIIFAVQKSSSGVLAFFAAVPLTELEVFALKCEVYLKVYIERKRT